ncbi:hypothetical protein KKF38_00315 [Patescibacteria group bacterium]|nr:hypothetical protein [Patescibacteria group bacterium]
MSLQKKCRDVKFLEWLNSGAESFSRKWFAFSNLRLWKLVPFFVQVLRHPSFKKRERNVFLRKINSPFRASGHTCRQAGLRLEFQQEGCWQTSNFRLPMSDV